MFLCVCRTNLAMETDFYLKNLVTNLWNFKQHDILCDTTIVAQNGEEIFAHSVILSAASNQLKSALSAEAESCSGNQCKKYRLSLVDYEPLLLNTVLQYMYTGQLELLKTNEGVQHPEEFLHELCGKLGLDLNINNTALQTKKDDNVKRFICIVYYFLL